VGVDSTATPTKETPTTATPGTEPPPFAVGSRLLIQAFAFARAAHHGARRRGETDIDHPVAVAEVLFEYGITDEEVLAAAFLHDVVEDTDTEPDEIGDTFGLGVQTLVEQLTENADIGDYVDRKAEHRQRVVRDRRASAIYAADKLATTRALHAAPEAVTSERIDHYLKTLELLCESHPELPFLPDLRAELRRLGSRATGSSAC
jgi:(p)ppGpp synthase/HD superfamily hydrolase